MDLWHQLLKGLDHWRYSILTFVLCGGLVAGMFIFFGCQSKTTALQPDPQGNYQPVDRREFIRQAMVIEKDFATKRIQLEADIAKMNEEIAAHNAKVEFGTEDMDKQDEFKEQFFNSIATVATEAAGGKFNLGALIPIAFGILGAGAGLGLGADKVRTGRVLAKEKEKNNRSKNFNPTPFVKAKAGNNGDK